MPYGPQSRADPLTRFRKKTSNDEIQMTNDQNKNKYDLEERTAKFAEEVIDFTKKLPKDPKYIDTIS